jgi:hypothetical protein
LIDSYQRALPAAANLVLESLAAETEEEWMCALPGTFAAFRGFPELGAAIVDLDREVSCPECDTVFLLPGYLYFT